MNELKKVLKPLHLWAIAVGLVISGEYFGWSYGWNVAGTVGFLGATILVAIMYVTFVFSFTELTTSIPHASGPFAYAKKAFGSWGGFIAGFSTLVEFLFAPPAIAFALGSYSHFIFPSIPVDQAAILIFAGFCAINLLGVHQTVKFELVVTIIAVAELLVFFVIVAPHFEIKNFMQDPYPHGHAGLLASIPYAIWFFLAIEGVAMAAEEVENPKRDIPIGYISGILTLLVLAIGVMLAAGGVGDWKKLSHMDYPVPEAMAMALGHNNSIVKALTGIGLFGLIASLNGIIYSSSRQVFALARSGFLPSFLAKVNKKYQSPQWAVVFCFFIGAISIYSGKTSQLITLSGMGAVLMYCVSMLALFKLRKIEPNMERPFRVPFYPYFPIVALILSILSFVTIIYFNLEIAVLFAALLAGTSVTFFLYQRQLQGVVKKSVEGVTEGSV